MCTRHKTLLIEKCQKCNQPICEGTKEGNPLPVGICVKCGSQFAKFASTQIHDPSEKRRQDKLINFFYHPYLPIISLIPSLTDRGDFYECFGFFYRLACAFYGGQLSNNRKPSNKPLINYKYINPRHNSAYSFDISQERIRVNAAMAMLEDWPGDFIDLRDSPKEFQPGPNQEIHRKWSAKSGVRFPIPDKSALFFRVSINEWVTKRLSPAQNRPQGYTRYTAITSLSNLEFVNHQTTSQLITKLIGKEGDRISDIANAITPGDDWGEPAEDLLGRLFSTSYVEKNTKNSKWRGESQKFEDEEEVKAIVFRFRTFKRDTKRQILKLEKMIIERVKQAFGEEVHHPLWITMPTLLKQMWVPRHLTDMLAKEMRLGIYMMLIKKTISANYAAPITWTNDLKKSTQALAFKPAGASSAIQFLSSVTNHDLENSQY